MNAKELGIKVALHELPPQGSKLWAVNVNGETGTCVVFCGEKDAARECFDKLAVALGLSVVIDGDGKKPEPGNELVPPTEPKYNCGLPECGLCNGTDDEPDGICNECLDALTDADICRLLFSIRFSPDEERWARIYMHAMTLDDMTD